MKVELEECGVTAALFFGWGLVVGWAFTLSYTLFLKVVCRRQGGSRFSRQGILKVPSMQPSSLYDLSSPAEADKGNAGHNKLTHTVAIIRGPSKQDENDAELGDVGIGCSSCKTETGHHSPTADANSMTQRDSKCDRVQRPIQRATALSFNGRILRSSADDEIRSHRHVLKNSHHKTHHEKHGKTSTAHDSVVCDPRCDTIG